jgi:hypothetical protein
LDKINPKYCIEGYLLNKLCNDAFIKDNYFWYKSKSIQKNYVEDQSVYNFEVDIDNSYIVENTIVHNCQAFSNAGNKQNFSDKRGMLFEHILRIAVEKKPSFLFLENVKHIKKISDGEVFKHILKRIDESGYYVDENKSIFELSPHQFGIPQHRERVIFVCIRKDIYDKEKVIEIIPPNSPINMEGIIETNINITNKYKISKEVESILDVWDEMVKICETNQNMSPTILCNEFNTIYTTEEFKKFLKMGLIFALIIGVYWTLRPLKDAIFIQLVGKLQLPYAKTVSVIALLPLVMFYTKLLEKTSREHKVYRPGA